jgi:hypothetical protein
MRHCLFCLMLMPAAAQATENVLLGGAQSVAGIYSSVYIHELGHALVFKAFGATDIDIEVPRKGMLLSSITTARATERFSASQRQILAVSGLASAALASEFVLRQPGLHKSRYAQAVLGTGLATNVVHVYDYYTGIRGKNGYTGNDIDAFELAGGNPHLFSATLLTYSVFALHRMRKKNIPLFYVNLKF